MDKVMRLFRRLALFFVVAIEGTALASASVTVAPREFDLGDLQVGIGRAHVRAEVGNMGTAEARLSLLYPGGAHVTPVACRMGDVYVFALPPGTACTLEIQVDAVTLVPSGTLGPGTATIELRVDGGAQVVPLALRWNAVPTYLAVDVSDHDFGAVALGSPASVTRIVRNDGPANLSFTSRLAMWPAFSCTYIFATAHIAHPTCYREHPLAAASLQVRFHGCEVLAPGQACTIEIVFDPRGAFSMRGEFELFYEAGGLAYQRRVPLFGTGIAPRTVAGTVLAVEYYNPGLQHYFVTAFANEQAALDAGGHGGWVRTGRSFWVHPSGRGAGTGVNGVCRYYGVPGVGPNSHFYSAIPDECEAVAQLYPDAWLLESPDVFGAMLPDTAGTCPAGTSPLFRLYNNRVDANHRYTTDPLIPGEMSGWIREGFGTQGVAMCVPQ